MSSVASPSPSTQHHDLSVYQDFVNRSTTHDDMIFELNQTAPTPLTSSSKKTIFQKLYGFFFNQQKNNIVQDFSIALEVKYGKDVASFAFSEDQKHQALDAGLCKSMITEVIENAIFAGRAKHNIKDCAEIVERNIQIAEKTLSEIEVSDLRGKFEKVKDFSNRQLCDFKNIEALKDAWQETYIIKMDSEHVVNHIDKDLNLADKDHPSSSPTHVGLKSKPLLNSDFEIEDSASVWRDVADAPMTAKTLQASLNLTRLQHEKVLSELEARFRTNPKNLEAQLENFSKMAVHAMQQIAPQLAVFANHVNDDPSTCFHLDMNGFVVARPASRVADTVSPLTAEENQQVWHLLCHTLETCYGKPLLQRMLPEEKRQELFLSSLTTAHLKNVFNDINCSLEADLEFLQRQPFIINKDYCDALSNNPQLLQEALEAEQKIAAHGTFSIQLARKLFDLGVIVAGYHAGGYMASGAALTLAAATGITLSAIPVAVLSLVASVGCAYIAARFLGSRTNEAAGLLAGRRAAAYTIGSFLGILAVDAYFGPGTADLSTWLLQTSSEMVVSTLGAVAVDAAHHRIVGTTFNEINVIDLPAPSDGIHPYEAADTGAYVLSIFKDLVAAVDQLPRPALTERARPRVSL